MLLHKLVIVSEKHVECRTESHASEICPLLRMNPEKFLLYAIISDKNISHKISIHAAGVTRGHLEMAKYI